MPAECDNMADLDSAIESETHGNVLWAPLDHGATRIGYAYSPAIAAKYPDGVTQEVVVQEAIESMKPFKVEFKEIHWWTLYTIGQRIAKTFSSRDRIFLCGDAAHTHSSGAAQGLNTGIHDAVNLAWKLALQIQGTARPEVLQTYASERASAVQKLIEYDKDIALLMSYKWPAWYKGDAQADPHLVLGEIFDRTASFNTGLGISYLENILNQKQRDDICSVIPGSRPPDVKVTVPGTNQGIRLQDITPNQATFWVLIFTGSNNLKIQGLMQELQRFLDTTSELISCKAIRWLTIITGAGCSPYEALERRPFGDAYFDADNVAHDSLGIQLEEGAGVILRPDGMVGTTCGIRGDTIHQYLSSILYL
jgi:phenol 2-monooxygenase